MRASRKADPPSNTNKLRRSAVAANRTRHRIGHHRPHAGQGAVGQQTGHGERDVGIGNSAADHRENVTNHGDEAGGVETAGIADQQIEKVKRPVNVIGTGIRSHRQDYSDHAGGEDDGAASCSSEVRLHGDVA